MINAYGVMQQCSDMVLTELFDKVGPPALSGQILAGVSGITVCDWHAAARIIQVKAGLQAQVQQ